MKGQYNQYGIYWIQESSVFRKYYLGALFLMLLPHSYLSQNYLNTQNKFTTLEAKGVKMGRKVGSIKSKEQKTDEYSNVIKHLKKGQSIRNTAKLCSVSVSTVQRIKKEFGL